MPRAAVLFAAGLFTAPLFAQEQIYFYVKHRDAAGESARYRLECIDARCKLGTKAGEREVSLTAEQKQRLVDALQAESQRFFVAAEPAAGADDLIKVKLRYGTAGKRLEIERRLTGDKPVDLTPEMLELIETHFELDLSKPAAPDADAGESPVSPGALSGAG